MDEQKEFIRFMEHMEKGLKKEAPTLTREEMLAAVAFCLWHENRRTTPDRECEWKCDDIDNGIWESACGEVWSFIDGGPVENRMLFCHRCGGKLKTAPTSDQGEKS